MGARENIDALVEIILRCPEESIGIDAFHINYETNTVTIAVSE